MTIETVAGEDPLLADLTTLRVGGPARRVVVATTDDDVVRTALEAWADEEPLLVLGGGSNVVVGDDGFDGTVLVVATRGIERLQGVAHATAGGPPTSPADRLRSPRALPPTRAAAGGGARARAGGRTVGCALRRSRAAGMERYRGALRRARLLRRRTHPEHRRLRPGARGDARGRRVPRSGHRHRAPSARVRAAARLPHQRVQAGHRPASCSRSSCCCTARSATARC